MSISYRDCLLFFLFIVFLFDFVFFSFFFFFFNDTATTEIYTFPTRRSSDLQGATPDRLHRPRHCPFCGGPAMISTRDRKSTRLNSSHPSISYAVFCLKKK